MKVFHLSHTDLDGYGAQFITRFYLNDVVYFNSNYGKEIDDKFEQILSLVNEGDLVLITDLNLTLAQCENFQNKLKEKRAKIILLDHHQSGLECAKKYPWYLLDSSRCATAITHDFFAEIYGVDEELAKFTKVVNAVDIWLSDEDEFEMGKVCLGLVANAKEINKIMFEEKSREFIFYILEKSRKFYMQKNGHIALDEATHGIKKEFFKKGFDDTLSNLVSKFIVDMLSENRAKFEISYENKKGILTYNIGNTSVIGNDFLVANPDIDFFIDVTSRKTLSFRANGNANVSLMAKHLVGGGGHINASGGLFAGFKDGYTYETIKTQITDLIAKKTLEKEVNSEK